MSINQMKAKVIGNSILALLTVALTVTSFDFSLKTIIKFEAFNGATLAMMLVCFISLYLVIVFSNDVEYYWNQIKKREAEERRRWKLQREIEDVVWQERMKNLDAWIEELEAKKYNTVPMLDEFDDDN